MLFSFYMLYFLSTHYSMWYIFQVQGLVNTFGDLRGSLAAVERINSVFSGGQIDEALAYGLERDIRRKEVDDEKLGLFFVNGFDEKNIFPNIHYMSALRSASNVHSLAWSGDVCLEGTTNAVSWIKIKSAFTCSLIPQFLDVVSHPKEKDCLSFHCPLTWAGNW